MMKRNSSSNAKSKLIKFNFKLKFREFIDDQFEKAAKLCKNKPKSIKDFKK